MGTFARQIAELPMSLLGQSRHFERVQTISASPQCTDILSVDRQVRVGLQAAVDQADWTTTIGKGDKYRRTTILAWIELRDMSARTP
jgi:hypothetical protein